MIAGERPDFEILAIIMVLTGMILISVVMMVKLTYGERKTPAFKCYIVMHAGQLTGFTGAFLKTVAPTKSLVGFYNAVIAMGLIMVLCGGLLFCKRFDLKSGTQAFLQAVAGLASFGTGTMFLLSESRLMVTLLAIIPFSLFIGSFYYFWKDHFVDLSRAFDELMFRINEAVFVFDNKGILISSSSLDSLSELKFEKDLTVDTFREIILSHWTGKNDSISRDIWYDMEMSQQAEIELNVNQKTVDYLIALTPLGTKSKNLGTVISLREISQEKELERNLEQKNHKLQAINSELRDLIGIAQQLEEEQVRNQIVTEVKRTLGNELDRILLSLKKLKQYPADELGLHTTMLQEATSDLRHVLEQIREVVGKMLPAKRADQRRQQYRASDRRLETDESSDC